MKTSTLRSMTLVCMLMITNFAFAQKTWDGGAGTNNWGDANNWNGNALPLSTETVTLKNNTTVNVNVNTTCAAITFPAGANNVTLNINSAITLTVTGAINIPRSGSSMNTLAVGAGTLSAGSIAFTSSGTTVRHQLTISTGTATISGNITADAAAAGSPSIVFSGAGTLKVGGTIYNNTAGTLTTVSGSTVEYNGAAAQTIGDYTYDNLTLSGSGAKTVTGSSVNATLSIKGTATAAGSSPTFGASSTLEYAGSSTQTTSNVEFPSSNAARNLKINNANDVTLHAARNISGVLTLANGELFTTSTNLLTLNAGASVSGGSDASYVSGPMKKIGNTAFTFPLGKSGIYGYLAISAPSVATDAFTAEYFRGAAPDYASRASQISQLSKVDYWRLDRSAGTSMINVTLSWSLASADASITSAYGANSTVARHNISISKWNAYSNSGGFSGSFATGGSITWNNVNSYNDYFTIGLAPSGTSLPVKFTGVAVKKEGSAARITWNVATEENLSSYQVEKSADGNQFTSISSITARNYSSYSYLDGPSVAGKLYYRIKSVDADGKYAYSPVVSLSGDQSNVQLRVFPIPAQNQITIQHPASENAKITLSSADGRIMKSVLVTRSTMQTSIDISSLKAGLYIIQFTNGEGSEASTMKIIKQ